MQIVWNVTMLHVTGQKQGFLSYSHKNITKNIVLYIFQNSAAKFHTSYYFLQNILKWGLECLNFRLHLFKYHPE